MALYSVVIPCYKSSETIKKVVDETIEEFNRLEIDEFEFILVNDCSPDNGATREAIFSLADKYSFVKAVDLGKNAGQHNATMAGLNYASGDFVISMDDDGQTSPSQIEYLFNKIKEGYDIVYGYYRKKKENPFRRFGSLVNHLTVRALIHKPKWLKTSSFWIIRKYVRDYAIQYKNANVHLQGVFLRITRNVTCVQIEHFERTVGNSGYTLKKLIGIYSSILGFSMLPVRSIELLGLVLFVFGGIACVFSMLTQASNVLLYALLFMLTGVIVFSVGVIGEYVARTYNSETDMPQFVVREAKNIVVTGKEHEKE